MNILRCTLGRTARTTALRPTLLLSASLALLLAPPLSRAGDCDPHWLPAEGLRGTDFGYVNSSTLWDPDGLGPRTPLLVIAGRFNAISALNAQNIALYDPDTEEWSAFPAVPFPYEVRRVISRNDGALFALGPSPIGPFNSGQVLQWTGDQWTPLGDWFDNTLHDACILANGDLVVCGAFTMVGSTPANGIARWDGTQWRALADGVTGWYSAPAAALSLLALPDGDLIVAGNFLNAGGQPSPKFARWNGAEWTPMPGNMNGAVADIALRANGEILAACNANDRGVVFRWTGSNWANFTTPLFHLGISTLLTLPDNSFIAAGPFVSAAYGPTPSFIHPPFRHVARWHDASWLPMNSGVEAPMNTLTLLPDGDVFAGGAFVNDLNAQITPVDVPNLARWHGAEWRAMTRGVAGPINNAVATPHASVIVPGRAGDPTSRFLLASEFDGIDWSPINTTVEGGLGAFASHPDGGIVGRGWEYDMQSAAERVVMLDDDTFTDLPEPPVRADATLALPDGRVIIGSQFPSSGGQLVFTLENNAWVPLAGGPNGAVRALTRLQNGDVIAAGDFNTAGGQPSPPVARWNGQEWSPLGAGLTGSFHSIVELPSGNIAVAGYSNVALWNGSSWSSFATPGFTYSLSALSTGDIVVSTAVSPSGSPAVWRWTGQTWTPLGPDFNGAVRKLTRNSPGELIAVGDFSKIGDMWSAYFARWTDTNIPWVARHPQPQSINPSESASFSAWPATGYTNLEASWQLETAPHSNTYADLIDGPIPNSQGATASITPLLPSHRPGATTLTLSNITPSLHYRRVRALINNSCGVSISNPALLTLNNAPCPGDTNGDQQVNFLDLNLLLSSFGASVPPGTLGDLNNDGAVDFLDLNILLSFFGTAC